MGVVIGGGDWGCPRLEHAHIAPLPEQHAITPELVQLHLGGVDRGCGEELERRCGWGVWMGGVERGLASRHSLARPVMAPNHGPQT